VQKANQSAPHDLLPPAGTVSSDSLIRWRTGSFTESHPDSFALLTDLSDPPRTPVRRLGKRVGLTPSRVRISYPPHRLSSTNAVSFDPLRAALRPLRPPSRLARPATPGDPLRRHPSLALAPLDSPRTPPPATECRSPSAPPARAPTNRPGIRPSGTPGIQRFTPASRLDPPENVLLGSIALIRSLEHHTQPRTRRHSDIYFFRLTSG
jgi:hypothetical protein